ncbi:hypothetical protein Tco_1071037 [Tanacetum coccineum]|uniref:Uncharacterized protein n=1 Tax=Tanacetum coccineum TaxID=301880 RepID=A0ABQ5HND5_9ASTR
MDVVSIIDMALHTSHPSYVNNKSAKAQCLHPTSSTPGLNTSTSDIISSENKWKKGWLVIHEDMSNQLKSADIFTKATAIERCEFILSIPPAALA